MKIFHAFNDFASPKKTVITLGTFDGVHVGHKQIIDKLVKSAKLLGYESVILTFFPHPRMVLQGSTNIKLLNTIEEKSDLLEKSGVDNLLIHPFDEAFSNLSAEDFVKNILVGVFNIQKIIIGYDHRFGKNRAANIDDLIFFGKKYNFEVEEISSQEIDDVAVSSTKIRNALLNGNILTANEYLGYHYFITGKVVHGKKNGKAIGFPTANIEIAENYKLIPQNGVYIVQSVIYEKLVFGMMNIGYNPTLNGEKLTIEVHFFDFDTDIYDQKISISILERIRSEKKFDSLEHLKLQLANDEQTARNFIKVF